MVGVWSSVELVELPFSWVNFLYRDALGVAAVATWKLTLAALVATLNAASAHYSWLAVVDASTSAVHVGRAGESPWDDVVSCSVQRRVQAVVVELLEAVQVQLRVCLVYQEFLGPRGQQADLLFI